MGGTCCRGGRTRAASRRATSATTRSGARRRTSAAACRATRPTKPQNDSMAPSLRNVEPCAILLDTLEQRQTFEFAAPPRVVTSIHQYHTHPRVLGHDCVHSVSLLAQ